MVAHRKNREIWKVTMRAEDWYEGNLVLTDIKLVNVSTGQIIKSFNNVNLCSNFYVDEDEDIDYKKVCHNTI